VTTQVDRLKAVRLKAGDPSTSAFSLNT
jgi:hypothetical protein